MAGRVIQGFFTDGGRLSRAVSDRTSAVAQRVAAPARAVHTPGPPAAAFAGRAGAIQQRGALGRPPLAHGGAASPVQRFGGDGSFAIDPVQVGLARSGGIPLPKPVLAKMETAFGADFSAVRVHVGPQASRIGAIAFTTGNDLYFAPGQFQPDSVKGQQLIGHELAHVIQQRQGRVRAPGSGVAVVQDRMLEAEADRLGMRAAAPSARATLQRATAPRAVAPGRPRLPLPPVASAGRPRTVQRCMEMEHPGALDYNGDLIGMSLKDPDVNDLLADLKNNHGYTAQMIETVKEIIEASPVYIFDDPSHLKNFVNNPKKYPPQMGLDDDAAELVNDLAGDFGSAFKGPKVAFSGSRVYAVAYSEGATNFWAMLNSATGYVGKQQQSVVATWQQPTLPYSFPSNTLKNMSGAKLKRPTVMTSNAHAEVNEIVQHAIRSLVDIHAHPHNVGLIFGSDIAHCAECYWAAHAMWKKGGKTPYNNTGCENRLFARWREPWDGFYNEYGANPFRNTNGTLKNGFTTGANSTTKLNSKVSGSVGNIYK